MGQSPRQVTTILTQGAILPGYKWHERVCPIDIKSFEGTDASDSNWEKKSSDALERIAKAIEKRT